MQWYTVPADSVLIDDVLSTLRTGDLILFKAYNHMYSALMGTYYTHCGIVVMRDGVPYCFEAASVASTTLLPHHNRRGIFCTRLAQRVHKYPGACYVKKVNVEIPPETCAEFEKFIAYAHKHMQYREEVVRSAIEKLFGKLLDHDTNCGEMAYLSLIKLGILNIDQFDIPRAHHLRFINNCTDLYSDVYGHVVYSQPIRLTYSPF